MCILVPDNIHGSRPHFGITAHDRHAGSKWPIDAEYHKLCASRDNSQVAVCKRVVTPGERTDQQRVRKRRATKDQSEIDWTQE